MRILHIVEAFAGGILTFLQGLINESEDEHIVLYARRDNTPKEPEKLFRKGTRLICSAYLTRELRLEKDVAAFFEIRRVVCEIQPDIVHLHSSKAGALGRWAINGKKMPLFYTPHGYSFLMEGCGRGKRLLYFLLEKLCGYRICTTVACGKGEWERGRRVTANITYINNGVNTEELDRVASHNVSVIDEMRICTLARISTQKNPELFNRIAEAFPQVPFTWIGDGELREMLTSPNIEITGWLPREEALAKMMGSTIFLLPSLWEGLSLSLVEAMYFKLLCIVSRIPGNVDAIQDGETGYVCGAFEEYVKVINSLLENGIDKTILDRARAQVKKELNQHVMAEQYVRLYRMQVDGISNSAGGV